jgi:hypothetical protein
VAFPTTLHFFVSNLEAVRKHYDVIKVHRSIEGRAGPYTVLTGPGTGSPQRIPLVSGQIVYEFTDVEGDGAYWYRTSYLNTDTGGESSMGEPIRGDLGQALDVITVDELKSNYLFGLDLTDDAGNELPDTIYEWYIQSAVSLAERQLDIPIRTQVYDEAAIDGGVSERQDYIVQEYYKFIYLQLNNYPVIDVTEVKMVLPTDDTITTFTGSNLHVDKDSGQVMVIPDMNTTVMLGSTSAWLPLIYGWVDFVPDVFRIKYTAGFANGVPFDIKSLVGKMASLGPLAILGDLIIGAGIASQQFSMDGLSQAINSTASATNSGYGARIRQYSREIKDETLALRRYYKGIKFQMG